MTAYILAYKWNRVYKYLKEFMLFYQMIGEWTERLHKKMKIIRFKLLTFQTNEGILKTDVGQVTSRGGRKQQGRCKD